MKKILYASGRNGSKPMGEEPMTAAQRKQRSRLKLKQEGGKEYQIKLNEDEMAHIDLYAKTFQLDTSKALKNLFTQAVTHISDAMSHVTEMNKAKATDNEVITFLHSNLFTSPKLKKKR